MDAVFKRIIIYKRETLFISPARINSFGLSFQFARSYIQSLSNSQVLDLYSPVLFPWTYWMLRCSL